MNGICTIFNLVELKSNFYFYFRALLLDPFLVPNTLRVKEITACRQTYKLDNFFYNCFFFQINFWDPERTTNKFCYQLHKS